MSAEGLLGANQGYELVRFFFLLCFAACIPAIISGGIAERTRFWPQVLAGAIFRITSYNVCYTKLLRLDKESWPRYKTCGGGLTGRALHELPAGFNLPTQHLCHSSTIEISDSGLSFTARRDKPIIRNNFV